MVNYGCKDLHLRCFQESWKCCCSLSLLLLYQVNVVFIICGYWLLQNLEKRKKSNKFKRLQIEVFFLLNVSPPEYRPINFVHIQGGPQKCPYFPLAIIFTKIRKASRFFLHKYWKFTEFFWRKPV